MRSTSDIAWATGLFEGEGTIGGSHPVGRKRQMWRLALCSTDEDVVRRFHGVFPGALTGPHEQTGLGTKPFWKWVCYRNADTLAYLMTMSSLFGVRRREKAAECIRDLVSRGDIGRNGRPVRRAA